MIKARARKKQTMNLAWADPDPFILNTLLIRSGGDYDYFINKKWGRL